jgi:hypothetical protein
VARVALLCPDLLFGSKVEGALAAAGHEVVRVDAPQGADGAEVLVVDLTADVDERIQALEKGAPAPVLAFYSHVEHDVRRRAEEAGVTRVVPRSRMARESVALVEALL